MPIKEVVTTQTIIPMVMSAATSDPVTGAILDTADYDNGVYFFIICDAYSSGTWTLAIQEDDLADMSTATTVGSTQLINALPIITAVTTVTAIGTVTGLQKVGIHSTKRYVRANIDETSAGTATPILV